MKNGLKSSMARSFSSNEKLNRKALQIKRSWEEVASLLKTVNNPKKK